MLFTDSLITCDNLSFRIASRDFWLQLLPHTSHHRIPHYPSALPCFTHPAQGLGTPVLWPHSGSPERVLKEAGRGHTLQGEQSSQGIKSYLQTDVYLMGPSHLQAGVRPETGIQAPPTFRTIMLQLSNSKLSFSTLKLTGKLFLVAALAPKGVQHQTNPPSHPAVKWQDGIEQKHQSEPAHLFRHCLSPGSASTQNWARPPPVSVEGTPQNK